MDNFIYEETLMRAVCSACDTSYYINEVVKKCKEDYIDSDKFSIEVSHIKEIADRVAKDIINLHNEYTGGLLR